MCKWQYDFPNDKNYAWNTSPFMKSVPQISGTNEDAFSFGS